MKYGESTETGYFGAMTTGVHSYGDLVSNYQGMQFWIDLLGKYGHVDQPFVQCVDNKWKMMKEFRWERYVDAGWDESINCNT